MNNITDAIRNEDCIDKGGYMRINYYRKAIKDKIDEIRKIDTEIKYNIKNNEEMNYILIDGLNTVATILSNDLRRLWNEYKTCMLYYKVVNQSKNYHFNILGAKHYD